MLAAAGSCSAGGRMSLCPREPEKPRSTMLNVQEWKRFADPITHAEPEA